MKNGLRWIGLIIATMIGAGYASGREIWQFFGYESGLAILIFAVLFGVSCYVILSVSFQLKSEHYLPVLQSLIGKRLARFYDWLILTYLFTTLFVMISGSGATFTIFNFSYLTGIMIIFILIGLVIPRGIDGILSVNRFLLPLLIVGLGLILILFIYQEHIHPFHDLKKQGNWSSSIPFTSLNVAAIIAVIGAIGKEIKSRTEIIVASIGSAVILGIISFLYNTSLTHVADQLLIFEIPLFAILNGYPFQLFLIMALLLWFAIYTTALTSLFALTSRLKEYTDIGGGKLGFIALLSALPFTFFGFSKLIAYLYPLYGLLNLYILFAILIFPLTKRAHNAKV
ncbi:hypothetical protein CEY16_11905 [Halalkalibacillus sediminis]|uniref:Membrane protein YkvI n=1 Tax=Halalkalibacillus sediminis TaxID=2018042 RepID=A0A2I0QSY3_9BACI|nr:hypothetical protein [Halalkalibacillus sediminis]PKR77426.1 hypothetical protein CEY16_11905 [Halalkalibacillus sediminis]